MRPKGKIAIALLVLVLITLLVVVMLRFADADTRARLYGWFGPTSETTQPVAPGSTQRP